MVAWKETNKEIAERPAEEIAKPFAIAAVVLPTASSSSVRSRTSSGRPAISAIPPALSATGPYASTPMVIAVLDSIPVAARATPKRPAAIPPAVSTAGNAKLPKE